MAYGVRIAGHPRTASFSMSGQASGRGQHQSSGGLEGRGAGSYPAAEETPDRQALSSGGPGLLSLVSLGPGLPSHMTPQAHVTLGAARVVFGYETAIDLVRPLLGEMEVMVIGKWDEVPHGETAIHRAMAGERVALMCCGDAGIYGFAELVLEICRAQGLKPGPPETPEPVDFFYEVIPGAPALTAAAALLGAPLMHDFAVISLSDLSTPWDLIMKRLSLAAQGDLVMVLYNPKSNDQDWQLGAVQELLLQVQAPETPVGIVTQAMRPGQQVVITSLDQMASEPVDMQTLIIVGNSQTYVYGSYMITPQAAVSGKR